MKDEVVALLDMEPDETAIMFSDVDDIITPFENAVAELTTAVECTDYEEAPDEFIEGVEAVVAKLQKALVELRAYHENGDW